MMNEEHALRDAGVASTSGVLELSMGHGLQARLHERELTAAADAHLPSQAVEQVSHSMRTSGPAHAKGGEACVPGRGTLVACSMNTMWQACVTRQGGLQDNRL